MPHLAITGAAAVRTRPFPAWPSYDDRERDLVQAVLTSRQWGGYPFPNRWARQFAEAFAAAHGARHALAAANGTVTLEIALRAVGLQPGDEVIVPAYTFEATAVPVLRLGGVPVFVDVLPDTYCLDPAAVEAALTPRTRAIIPVHLAMGMADLDALLALASRRGLRVIEDCAHGHGAQWRDRGAGSWGDAGSFSMQTSKLMTSGEGGALTTSDDELFEIAQSYVNCGRASPTDRFGHRLVGVNYRLTEFQAAILLAQLERLPEQTARRRARADRLAAGLASLQGLRPLAVDARVTRQAIYQFVVRYDAGAFAGASRDQFVAALELEGVPCDGLFYEPLYRSPLFCVRPGEFPALPVSADGSLPWADTRCPVAERAAYQESVWLPHQVLLGDERDVDDILTAIARIQRHADELRSADHPLIAVKGTNRAERR